MNKLMIAKRVTIGECDFAIFPFPAFTASTISGDLAKFFGPLIAGFLPLLGGEQTEEVIDSVMQMKVDDLVPSFIKAIQTLDGVSVHNILKELLVDYKNISVEYREDNGEMVQSQLTYELANQIFVGGLDEMIRLAAEVVKLNFGDFFGKLFRQYGNRSATTAGQKQSGTDTLTQGGFVSLS